jgi:hypothetical protein
MDGDESMLEPGVAGGFAVVYDQLSLPYGTFAAAQSERKWFSLGNATCSRYALNL